MFKFHIQKYNSLLCKRCCSVKTSTVKDKSSKNYQQTVFLPKTTFPSYFKKKEIVQRDERVQEEARFLEYYAWQRKNMRGKEFVLHDGPPYANGKAHMGHAINKILKDIILRSQLVQGNRVHFVPGWDCHGLPIENVALKTLKGKLNPKEIRQNAREIATTMSKIQKEAYKSWGVIGDWENNCYYTFSNDYIVNQLQIFWKLLEKGLIYYDLKPVFWSPSSRTALAEAELEYKNYECQALTVRFEIVQDSSTEPLYLLVWTTTPWTLPLNKVVYCSPNLKYSIVNIPSFTGSYIVATDMIPDLQEKLKDEITIKSVISSKDLCKLRYKHPWNKDKIMNIFESSQVRSFGTGFLHSVPGHGHEDYLLALVNNLEVECFVDEKGCYTSNAGNDLVGLNVLNEGSEYVAKRLSSEIVVNEKYTHSYPHDWRTNKPVIIRASKQWFIDTNHLKELAVESLKDVDYSREYFKTQLKQRPYWCLSRQRSWGVPIPVFFHKTSGRPLFSKRLINHLCNLIESFGPDVWWTEKVEVLFPERICRELFVKIEDVVKGEDIMDIWFDSGISWSYSLNGKKSEIYLEGVDQYGGWFQTSLFTCVGVRGEAPFKKIMTHGYAVDDKGRKMSKSVGNVVDPESLVKGETAVGVDVLRWWTGCHSHQNSVPVAQHVLKLDCENVQKIRSIFRFLLGALSGTSHADVEKCSELLTLDRYLLNSCYQFYHAAMNSYNSYEIHTVCDKIKYFVANEVSSRYITAVKDRLYCDDLNSVRRKACQYTINGILHTLCHVVAPILPHLAEEVYLHHPLYNRQKLLFYSTKMWTPPSFWQDNSTAEKIALLDKIKEEVYSNQSSQMSCLIQADEQTIEMLKSMQEGKEQSNDSELTEILQVSSVQLTVGPEKFALSPTESSFCMRCRRYTADESDNLCTRCDNVVNN